jgi:hypothetical protein
MRSLTTGTGIGVKMAIITEMNLGIKILNVTGIEIMGRRNTKLMITGGFWIQKQNS